MAKLYELSNDIVKLWDMTQEVNEKGEIIDPETGELIDTETLEELESNIMKELKTKGVGLIKAHTNMQADIDAVDAEILRLTKMKAKMTNSMENFDKYIMTNMIKMEMKKIEGPLGKITVGTSTATEIYDAANVPEQYKRKQTKIVEKISKTDLKKVLQTGELIPGARLKINHNIKFK